MTTAVVDWADVLDAYEERLGEFAALIRSSEGEIAEDVPDFDPPDGLGSIPSSLAPRAQALLEETNRLQSEYRVKMKSVLKEMQSNRRPQRKADRGGSAFVDYSA